MENPQTQTYTAVVASLPLSPRDLTFSPYHGGWNITDSHYFAPQLWLGMRPKSRSLIKFGAEQCSFAYFHSCFWDIFLQNYKEYVGEKCTFRLLNRGSTKALDKVVKLDEKAGGPANKNNNS